jgi:hypothetical protein
MHATLTTRMECAKCITPVDMLAFVLYTMNEMLFETVLENLEEMIGFDLLLLSNRSHYIQVFKVEQQNSHH